jgi:hypothetical protein
MRPIRPPRAQNAVTAINRSVSRAQTATGKEKRKFQTVCSGYLSNRAVTATHPWISANRPARGGAGRGGLHKISAISIPNGPTCQRAPSRGGGGGVSCPSPQLQRLSIVGPQPQWIGLAVATGKFAARDPRACRSLTSAFTFSTELNSQRLVKLLCTYGLV